jgi:hypothetical protein
MCDFVALIYTMQTHGDKQTESFTCHEHSLYFQLFK